MMWNFERFGDRTALVDEHGASLTYRQLKREADALCAAAGGRCLTFNLCRNTLGSLLGYAGFVEGGVVPVLLNEEMDRELLKGMTTIIRRFCGPRRISRGTAASRCIKVWAITC